MKQWRELGSVAVASLLWYGCAMHAGGVDAPAVRAGQSGLVIGVDAAAEAHTTEMASAIARRIDFGFVPSGVATGEYERRVRDAARGPLRFYVELRSTDGARLEIAAIGVDAAHATRLTTLLELTRDAHLRGRGEAPRLEVVMTTAPGEGVGRSAERALLIALPRAARHDFADVYTAILADFLAEAAALRPLP